MDLVGILNDPDRLVEPKVGFIAGFGVGLLGGFLDHHVWGVYTRVVHHVPLVGDWLAGTHAVLERYAYPAGMPVSYAAAGAIVGAVVLVGRRYFGQK